MKYPLCVNAKKPTFLDYHNAQYEVIKDLPAPTDAGFKEYGLSAGACNLWRALLDIWNAHPNCRKSNPLPIKRSTLCGYLKIADIDTIGKYTQELVNAGYIEWKRPVGRNDGGIYTLYSPIAIRDGNYIEDEFDTEKIGVKDDNSDNLIPKKSVSNKQQDTDSQPIKSVSKDTFFNNIESKSKSKNMSNIPPYNSICESKEGNSKGGEDFSAYEDLPGSVNEALVTWRKYLHSINRRFDEQALHDEAIRYVREIGAANYITALTKARAAGLYMPVISADMKQNARPIADSVKPKEPAKEYRIVSYAEAERLAEEREQQQQRQDEIQQEENPNLKRFNEALAAHFGGGKSGDIWR